MMMSIMMMLQSWCGEWCVLCSVGPSCHADGDYGIPQSSTTDRSCAFSFIDLSLLKNN
jgi:hypothetical protein